MFPDREAVVSSSAPTGQEAVSVQVYFPGVLTGTKPAPAK